MAVVMLRVACFLAGMGTTVAVFLAFAMCRVAKRRYDGDEDAS